jgi:hypothetical protein
MTEHPCQQYSVGLYLDGSYIGDQPTLQGRRDDIVQYLHRILQHMESLVIFFDNCDETFRR